MIHTVDSFYKEHHFYDYRVLSTLGFEEEDIASLRLEEDAAAVEGGWQYDVLVDREDGGTSVCKIYSITENINTLRLDEGRMPASADECVVDAENRMSLVLGDTLVLSSSNEKDTLEAFKNRRYTVVGFADTPLYINFERGTTTIGNGSVTGFAYFPRKAFSEDYYTEAYVLLKDQEELFSDAYEERLDEGRDRWEDAVRKAADARYERLLADAEKELADAKDEFEEKKTDGEAELDDAEKELRDGKAELDDASSELKDGREQLSDAQAELADAKTELDDAKTKLDSAHRELADAKKELDSGRTQLDASKKELEDGKKQLDASQKELADGKKQLDETQKELTAGKASAEILKTGYTEFEE